MIGGTCLAARVELPVPEDADGLRGYFRTEFRASDGLAEDGSRVTNLPEVRLNGGRNGWLAKARGAAAVAGVFLLSPYSRRGLAGRNAPNLLPGSNAESSPCEPLRH